MIKATFKVVPSIEDLFAIVPDLKLVLFDMDGTLVDSEHEHALAVIDVLKGFTDKAFEEKDIFSLVFGCPDPYSFDALKKMFTLEQTLDDFLEKKHIALDQIMSKGSHQSHPVTEHTKKLVTDLKAHSSNTIFTVVTASERRTAEIVLKKNFGNLFSQFFGREDTERSKPFPDPYENAFLKMNQISGPIHKHQVLIVEDSPYGLASALASGFSVIQAKWFTKNN